MKLARRLISRTRAAIRRFAGLAAWIKSWKYWDWLFDHAGTRSVPPRRIRLALEGLEERIAPSVTAINDSYSTGFAQPLSVQAAGVLGNDEGTNLSATLVAQGTRGTASINADGSLSYTQTDFAYAGTDQVTYRASDGVDASVATISIQIQQAPTTTALSASFTESYESDLITFTATVTTSVSQAGTPTGSVAFKNGSTVLGVVNLNANGVAAFSTDELTAGTHSITAEYSPAASSVFATSTSQPVNITVSPAPAWIEASQDDILVGNTVTFNAYPYNFDVMTVDAIEWDFNYDGTTFNPDSATVGQLSVTRTFNTPGTFTIAARMISGSVQMGTLEVRAHYPAPVLTTSNYWLTAGDTATLAIQAQFAANASFASIEWWFSYDGEDWEQDVTLTGLSHQVAFSTYGEVDVWVRVTDTNGESAEDGFHITVDAAVPLATAIATGPNGAVSGTAALLDEGQTATFTVWLTDRDIEDTDTIWANWYGLPGDENYEFVDPGESWVNPDGSISFQHVYDDNPAVGNVYHTIISIQNEGGDYVDCRVDVIVNNVAPTATLATGDWLPIPDRYNVKAYSILAGQNLEFRNLVEPSAADNASLVYHWKFDNAAAVTTETAFVALPDYTYGKRTLVEAWVTDKDGGGALAHQTIAVNVYPWYPTGLYGKMLLAGMDVPVDYDKYTSSNVIALIDNAPKQITLQLDQSSLSIPTLNVLRGEPGQFGTAPPNANTPGLSTGTVGLGIVYDFRIEVYDVQRTTLRSVLGTNYPHLLTTHFVTASPSPVLLLPGYPDDRQIIVYGHAHSDDVLESYYGLATQYVVILNTPRTQSTIEAAGDMFTLVRNIAEQFGNSAGAIIDAVTSNTSGFLTTLFDGFRSALTQITDRLPTTLENAVFSWLKGTQSGNFNANNISDLPAFLLDYAGLTWPHVQQVLMEALGTGNAAAVTLLSNLIKQVDPNDPNSPYESMSTFLSELPTRIAAVPELASAFDLNGMSLTSFLNEMKNKIVSEAASNFTKAIPQLAAKFVPGAGFVVSVYQGLQWVLANRDHLRDFFNELLSTASLDALKNNQPEVFATRLVNLFSNQFAPLGLSFLASQMGLGNLPGQIQNALQFVPSKVDDFLRKGIRKLAGALQTGPSSSTTNLYDGLLDKQNPQAFTYAGKQYVLWTAKDKTGVKVKYAEKTATGLDFKGVLKTQSFITSAQGAFGALQSAAQTYSDAVKKNSTTKLAEAARLQNLIAQAETQIIRDIQQQDACVALNAGCFRGSVKLETRDGWKRVDEITPADFVRARDEFDANGELAWKPVEAIFERTGRILEIVASGKEIATTPEHPFYVRRTENEGEWLEAGALHFGDEIRTKDGWVKIDEVRDTGLYEDVYNIRVADFHTYFVGDEDWGFAVWAHNACDIVSESNAVWKDPNTGVKSTHGKKFNITDTSNGYQAFWFMPTGGSKKAVKAEACLDNRLGIGNRLQQSVTADATAWEALAIANGDKYTQAQRTTITDNLTTINNKRAQYGLSPVDVNAFMMSTSLSFDQLPSTATQQDKDAYGAAARIAYSVRAAAKGNYVHQKMQAQWERPGTGFTFSDKGVDITYIDPAKPNSAPLHYEILRDTDSSWERHYRPTMAVSSWRGLTYT